MNEYRILCVDDDVMMLNTLEDILIAEGYDVSLAKSGAQAEKLLRRGVQCNLILLDVDMPEMDGYESFAKIRQIDGYDETPIIFLTGMDSPDFEIKGLEIGASDYIVKPFIKNVMLARIRGQLRNMERKAEPEEVYNAEALQLFEAKLNQSELMIAKYIADGLTNREISDRTHYSYNYVKKISSSVLKKMGLERRAEIRKMLKK